ncbi:MBL fold metallo-hydrolase [Aliidiomarina sp. Khilg15.8]
MYVNLRNLSLFAFLCLMVTACTSSNTITRIEGVQTKSASGRYSNLYALKDITYPVNCEQDCYPPHPDVDCESPGELCIYHGERPQLHLGTGFDVTWISHATFFITTPTGDSFLFDPVSAAFDWPINWGFELVGGRNRRDPEWISDADRENLTGVLYSHLHYDHFNKSDIRKLGSKPRYFAPLSMGDFFPSAKLNITEMAWFTETTAGSTKVHAVPATHFNSRTEVPFFYEDHNQASWGGWILESEGRTLFFAGDTGYSAHFRDIQQAYGDIDICLIPVASYHDEDAADWYRYVHTTPEDALMASQDLGCKVMVPWGYGEGSWGMGDKSTHGPLLRLLFNYEELGYQVPLYILNEGESVRF